MFSDRDLGILGAGALGAILCLMLPWSFALKVTVAVVILMVFMALAFLRLGGDRITLEQYLKRQLMFAFQPRRYSYFAKGTRNSVSQTKSVEPPQRQRPSVIPIAFKMDESGLYWLMNVWLVVIGAYVVYWAYFLGGAKDAAFWIQRFLNL